MKATRWRARGPLVMAVALLAVAGLPAGAQAQAGPTSAMDGAWHVNLVPYFWMSGIKGDLSVASLTSVPVDASFSDIIENFDIGLEGRFEARKDRLGFAFDFIWSNLGVPAAETEVADFTVDVRQFITEGFAFYRVATGGREDNPAHFDLLAGARYTSTRTRLTAESEAGVEFDGEYQELDWVDAMAGVQFRAPLGSRMALLGRGDVAGFGSNLTWNLEGDIGFRASEHWVLGLGWRHMDIDYDNDAEGLELRQFDLAYDGPRAWVAYSW